VQVVLSGMTTMDQIVENVRLFSEPEPTTATEQALLQRVVDSIVSLVPCTACRYCCDACPQNLDIPKLISMYNEASYERRLALLAFNGGNACGRTTRCVPGVWRLR
jgi:predicted aldo/keto reductase-like oxidoreductase